MAIIDNPTHAVAMDRMYRWQRPIYDLTRAYYLLGRDRAIRELALTADQRGLEIACGTARNLVQAARLYPTARLYGCDISGVMLDEARRNLRRAGLAGRIALAQGDATGFAADDLFGVTHFDRILISYGLSMIPNWQKATEHALALLKPGGALHIVDFGACERLPQVFRSVLYRWLNRFDVTPRTNIEAVLRDLSDRHGLSLTISRPFRGYAILCQVQKPI